MPEISVRDPVHASNPRGVRLKGVDPVRSGMGVELQTHEGFG